MKCLFIIMLLPMYAISQSNRDKMTIIKPLFFLNRDTLIVNDPLIRYIKVGGEIWELKQRTEIEKVSMPPILPSGFTHCWDIDSSTHDFFPGIKPVSEKYLNEDLIRAAQIQAVIKAYKLLKNLKNIQ